MSVTRYKWIFSGLMILLILGACSGGPRRTVEYIVVNITADTDGVRHNLRNADTGRPAYVVLPEKQFDKGQRIVMKRTRKTVSFDPVVSTRY